MGDKQENCRKLTDCRVWCYSRGEQERLCLKQGGRWEQTPKVVLWSPCVPWYAYVYSILCMHQIHVHIHRNTNFKMTSFKDPIKNLVFACLFAYIHLSKHMGVLGIDIELGASCILSHMCYHGAILPAPNLIHLWTKHTHSPFDHSSSSSEDTGLHMESQKMNCKQWSVLSSHGSGSRGPLIWAGCI